MFNTSDLLTVTDSTHVAPLHAGEHSYSLMPRRPRVILAESDDDLRSELHSLLHIQGYDVFACGDSHRALNVLHNLARLDLFICDLQLPLAGGLGAALYASFTHPSLPIILMAEKQPHQGLCALITDKHWQVMLKPFGSNELLAALQNLPTPLQGQWSAN